MSQVILYGGISGLSLVIGAVVGEYFKLKQKTIAAIMAFGSGVLICALTFGLMEESFKHGGFDAVVIGFLIGGIAFILGDYLMHKAGARRHKRKPLIKSDKSSNGMLIAIGAVLDGIPESIALGISLFAGGSTGLLMLVAITIANFPEGISSAVGLKKEGFSKKYTILMWTIIGLTTLVVTISSYIFLNDLDPNNIGILEAFAAGAILAMISDSMIPEAFEEGGFIIGMMTVMGFLLTFVISRL